MDKHINDGSALGPKTPDDSTATGKKKYLGSNAEYLERWTMVS